MDKIDAGRAVSRLRREAANSAPKAPRSEPAHTGEPGSPEWWRSPVCAIRGPVDTILRLLEQEEVSRRKALELMAHLYIAFPYDLRAEPAPAPPRAPWAALNWCDDRSDITVREACINALVARASAPPWFGDAAEALGEVRSEDGAPLALNWTQVISGIRELREDRDILLKISAVVNGALNGESPLDREQRATKALYAVAEALGKPF